MCLACVEYIQDKLTDLEFSRAFRELNAKTVRDTFFSEDDSHDEGIIKFMFGVVNDQKTEKEV